MQLYRQISLCVEPFSLGGDDMCKYYNQCGFCANFDKAADPDHGCKVFGPAIGDGQPFCGSFLCIVSDCHRFECISY